jgi:hypothetical protein
MNVNLLIGCCCRQLRRSEQAFSRAERLRILGHHFAFKPFAAVREAFSNAYLREVLNKTLLMSAVQ